MRVYDMEKGMHYQCQRCGNCCRWPGEVPVGEAEIERIAAYLGLDPDEFVNRHTELRADRRGLTLKEHPDGSCLFLDGIDCSIQPVKPEQCSGFPNQWNFPGWQDRCEAIALPLASGD